MPFFLNIPRNPKAFCSTTLVLSCFVVLIPFLMMSCAQKQTPRTEILWDTWGIPHIYAQDHRSLFYAFGWAQMESHADAILHLYGQARGRAAEYWGEKHIESDWYIRVMGVPERGREWYEAQQPPFREYLDAFVEGMNAYADAHGDKISDDVKVVLPVEPVDVTAHAQRIVHLAFVGRAAIRLTQQWRASGSNAWAIGPKRSADGHAMLLSNPHLPWADLFLFFEAQLKAPDMDAYGVAFIGLPMLAIGFNDYLGWTHTVNSLDGMDMYELTLSGDGYLFNGTVHPFDKTRQIMRIKNEDGGLRKEELIIHRSVHGPILAHEEGKALAVRLVGLDQPNIFKQYWDMIRSTNLNEFETALKRLQQPFFNVIYADRDGHIMYLFGGRLPKRAGGSWYYWNGFVPGSDSTTLWTETHPYADLPRIVDPPSGWLQNTNDPPWTATFPIALDPDDFPSYMAPRHMSLRSQRSVRMLSEDESITFDEMVRYKHSTHMELADRILDDLIPAVRKYGNDSAKQAADVLEAWDRRADANSKGAVLFSAWIQEAGLDLFAIPWDENNPLSTPDGLADPENAVSALETAASNMKTDSLALDVPWGDIHRLRSAGIDLPANGAPDWMGVLRVLFFTRDDDGRFHSSLGDSYVSIVEFSNPVRATALLSYGNASQPGSPHKGDQLELFSKKELRPVWRTREETEAHLEKKEVF